MYGLAIVKGDLSGPAGGRHELRREWTRSTQETPPRDALRVIINSRGESPEE